ncbi:MAG: ATP-binding protein [Muribaculaceae bacterium]|nr:ATP-binding protein [Muribaculaceae bacterium]
MSEKIIPRPHYLQEIERRLGKEMIIALTGQRRVGKSYVLKAFRAEKESLDNCNVIYIDKERREFDAIGDYRQLNEFISERFQSSKTNYILIDEVQEIEGFEKSLRSWRTEPLTHVVVTGSNAHILSGELATLIGGRCSEVYVQSLSYNEFLGFHQLQDSDEALLKYLDYGGLPALVNFGLNADARQYQSDVLHTALLKDIIGRVGVRNVGFLNNLLRFVGDNTGKPISPYNISNYMKSHGESVSPTMIGNYLKYISEAYIIKSVNRYDIHGKALLDSNCKYYFEDVGIRNALVGGSRQKDIEKVIENVVYQQLIRLGYEVAVGQLKAGEVDFVCNHVGEGSRIYIQVAYLVASDETYNREFGTLHRLSDNYPKYVISMTPLVDKLDDDGIIHLGLRHFLTKGL